MICEMFFVHIIRCLYIFTAFCSFYLLAHLFVGVDLFLSFCAVPAIFNTSSSLIPWLETMMKIFPSKERKKRERIKKLGKQFVCAFVAHGNGNISANNKKS